MTEFVKDEYKKLKEEFIRVSKRILKQDISKVEETLRTYRTDIVTVHDALIGYIKHFYGGFDTPTKVKYKGELVYIRRKIVRCFEVLRIEHEFSEFLLARIEDTSRIEESELESESDTANLTVTDLDIVGEESSDSDDTSEEQLTMADQRLKFVSLCASTLNRPYAGDPLGLQGFICGIELLETLAGDHLATLTAFIKTRLEGKALECIPTDNVTIANIKSSLRAAIKPESSKVVEGKILALRFNPTKPTDFSNEATALAEAFQRSLIIEGIPQAKAKSMAVEKAVEICRKNAKSDTVKAILASKEFTEPAEVVAKLIIEANQAHQEQQVLSFRQSRNNRGKNGRYRGNGQNNRNGNGQNNYNNNNGGRNNRGQNNRGNYQNQGNHQGQGNYQNQGGNRGSYRGNGNNRGYTNQGQYVRVVSNSGNGQLPSNERRAIAYHNAPMVQMPMDP